MSDRDYATDKRINLTKPEELVRQDFERVLVEDYRYEKSDIDINVSIPLGSSSNDFANVVVYRSRPSGDGGRNPATDIIGIIETRKPGDSSGKDQLKSYITATSAVWGVWTNGEDIEYYCKPQDQHNVLENTLNNIPVRGQRVEDVGKLTRADLKPYSPVALKSIFRRILNMLYANANISRREKLGNEMIKLIFAKIQDEKSTSPKQSPSFRAGFGEKPKYIEQRIKKLFNRVVKELAPQGIFEPHESITLDSESIARVIGQLERGSLTETPTDVVGDAFEVFAESKFVGEKGEFFTPRSVIEVAIKLVNPKPKETICDPACGSGGFLISAMRSVWQQMENKAPWRNLPRDSLSEAKKQMADRCFFGIDKEVDLVRIAKAYMAISGDGRSNVVHTDSLNQANSFTGQAQTHFVNDGEFKKFDCILTNPPYATKTKIPKDKARNFDLGHTWRKSSKGERWKWKKGAPCDQNPYILFVERCFDMLKDGGRLAIILPETAFHAPSMEHLRYYVASRSQVLAVVDLPHNTFRPYCNAKTCLLVVKKGRPASDNDRIIMAEAREVGHDHHGKTLYRPNTRDVWNDLPLVSRELDDPDKADNDFVLTVSWADVLKSGNWIPRYYFGQANIPQDTGRYWLSLGELEDIGIIKAWDGHGSPKSLEKGKGSVPYFRVADVVNWEMYRNPTSGVTDDVFKDFTKGKNKKLAQEGDIIFVKRGSYRIGTVAIASKRDSISVFTKELLTFRVLEPNKLQITPYYLLILLSSAIVQNQLCPLIFIDTTLPNIGDRWRMLRIPIHRHKKRRVALDKKVKSIFEKKWGAQRSIDKLRSQIGGITT